MLLTAFHNVVSAHMLLAGDWKRRDYPQFVKNFLEAHEKGLLQIQASDTDFAGEHEAQGLLSQSLADILTGISVSLKQATTHGRILTSNEKLFYATLYNVKGPWAHNLTGGVLLGPCEDTTRKFRAALSNIFDPFWKPENVVAIKEVIAGDQDRYPCLEEAPGVCAEDATALSRKIEGERIDNHYGVKVEALTVRIWGLDGCCSHQFIIHSVGELKALMDKCTADDIAAYMYAWVWVPVVKHAPWFPLRIEITNNKFDKDQIFKWWREIDAGLALANMLTIGKVGDGDARYRCCSFRLMRELGNNTTIAGHWLLKRIGSTHRLVDFLKVAITVENHNQLAFTDPMHLLWR
jgi:hypothetical protein